MSVREPYTTRRRHLLGSREPNVGLDVLRPDLQEPRDTDVAIDLDFSSFQSSIDL